MPLCTLHLLSLHPSTLPPFLSSLPLLPSPPLLLARPIRWIIPPTTLSTTSLVSLNITWDILLVLPDTSPLPPALMEMVKYKWSITVGIPSRLTQGFRERNEGLLKPELGDVFLKEGGPGKRRRIGEVEARGRAEELGLSGGLKSWCGGWVEGGDGGGEGMGEEVRKGPVSMFNLLAFKPGMKESYLEYGKHFAEHVGSKHGGVAKLVGGVVKEVGVGGHVHSNASPNPNSNTNGNVSNPSANAATSKDVKADPAQWDDDLGWDEFAIAQYPSLEHFVDMLGDEKYQEVNRRWRVPALRDTAILMTSEIGVGVGMGGGRAKL